MQPGRITGIINATVKLLTEFKALRFRKNRSSFGKSSSYLPPWDSGPLSDDVASPAGDQLAAMHDEEERAS